MTKNKTFSPKQKLKNVTLGASYIQIKTTSNIQNNNFGSLLTVKLYLNLNIHQPEVHLHCFFLIVLRI